MPLFSQVDDRWASQFNYNTPSICPSWSHTGFSWALAGATSPAFMSFWSHGKAGIVCRVETTLCRHAPISMKRNSQIQYSSRGYDVTLGGTPLRNLGVDKKSKLLEPKAFTTFCHSPKYIAEHPRCKSVQCWRCSVACVYSAQCMGISSLVVLRPH